MIRLDDLFPFRLTRAAGRLCFISYVYHRCSEKRFHCQQENDEFLLCLFGRRPVATAIRLLMEMLLVSIVEMTFTTSSPRKHHWMTTTMGPITNVAADNREGGGHAHRGEKSSSPPLIKSKSKKKSKISSFSTPSSDQQQAAMVVVSVARK